MTGPLHLAFPSSRVLSGWWKQLQTHAPDRLWIAHLFCQRIEAQVQGLATRPLDPTHQFLLRALKLESARGDEVRLEQLHQRLGIPVPLLREMLRRLHAHGLTAPGVADETWKLSAAGIQALACSSYLAPEVRRALFTFWERLGADGKRSASPHYLPMTDERGQTWQRTGTLDAPMPQLLAAFAQSPEWKQRFGFPEDVSGLLSADSESWTRIPIVRSERMVAVLVEKDRRLEAYLARMEGWMLESRILFRLPNEAVAELPDLAPAATLEQCKTAWLTLAEGHKLTPAEAESAELTLRGIELTIQLAPELAKRVRFRGDDWFLVGEGLIRPALRALVTPT